MLWCGIQTLRTFYEKGALLSIHGHCYRYLGQSVLTVKALINMWVFIVVLLERFSKPKFAGFFYKGSVGRVIVITI